jgi:hypothetical protein
VPSITSQGDSNKMDLSLPWINWGEVPN